MQLPKRETECRQADVLSKVHKLEQKKKLDDEKKKEHDRGGTMRTSERACLLV
jgi:hypothetical protein